MMMLIYDDNNDADADSEFICHYNDVDDESLEWFICIQRKYVHHKVTYKKQNFVNSIKYTIGKTINEKLVKGAF